MIDFNAFSDELVKIAGVGRAGRYAATIAGTTGIGAGVGALSTDDPKKRKLRAFQGGVLGFGLGNVGFHGATGLAEMGVERARRRGVLDLVKREVGQLKKTAIGATGISTAQMAQATPADAATRQRYSQLKQRGLVSQNATYIRSTATGQVQKIAGEKNQRFNKEKLKQFLGNTALIAGGSGVGYGTAEAVRHGLKKFRGSRGSKIRQVAALALPMVGGAAVVGYKQQLDKEKKKRLEEAYQRGVAKGQRDI